MWRVFQTPEYVAHGNQVRRTANSIAKAAQEKNLDEAALGYVGLTMQCVECQKYVRYVRRANIDVNRAIRTAAHGNCSCIAKGRRGPSRWDIPTFPQAFQQIGQPVLIDGSIGTGSYILVGTSAGESRSFESSYHGAGRAMSRDLALKQWRGRALVDQLASEGILIRSPPPSCRVKLRS